MTDPTPIEQQAREIAERHGWYDHFRLYSRFRTLVCEALLTKTPEEEKMKQLGGGTANNMRAFGWEVRAPSDPTDCASFEVSNRHRPEQVWLAKDEAEGWQIAEREQGLRGIQQIKPAPTKPDELPEWVLREAMRLTTEEVARLLVERDEHPNAADWRNRAERAEAQLAEVLAERGELRSGLDEQGEPVDDENLHRLVNDLRPYADKQIGSLRIDMADVRSILALFDAQRTSEPKEDPDLVLARVTEKVARAICRANTEQRCRAAKMAGQEFTDAVESQVENGWDLWKPEAETAIKHLREAGWKEGV